MQGGCHPEEEPEEQVKINGRKAGSMHQGAFYRFIYNVSDRVFFGSKKRMYLK